MHQSFVVENESKRRGKVLPRHLTFSGSEKLHTEPWTSRKPATQHWLGSFNTGIKFEFLAAHNTYLITWTFWILSHNKQGHLPLLLHCYCFFLYFSRDQLNFREQQQLLVVLYLGLHDSDCFHNVFGRFLDYLVSSEFCCITTYAQTNCVSVVRLPSEPSFLYDSLRTKINPGGCLTRLPQSALKLLCFYRHALARLLSR